MAYATVSDVEARMTTTLSDAQETACSTLLDDAAVIIDAVAPNASSDAKLVVSCRMVIRAIGADDGDVPLGATQGSIAALGYSQSWTLPSNAATGELYLSKMDKQLLGLNNSIGSYSPTEELVPQVLPFPIW